MKLVSLRHHRKSAAVRALRFTFLALTTACLMSGCEQPAGPVSETIPLATPTPAADANSGQPLAQLPPPNTNDVNQAIQRVFKSAAVLDATGTPAFVSGDFNGDRSPDLAVVLKPVPEKLAELNEEFPNWILRDPFAHGESRGPRLAVAANEPLLAVIHGYGPNGWRDPQATQTFLLKNAAGSSLQTLARNDAIAKAQGKKAPQLRGDVIGEQVGGASGYLYFAVAGYAWYDPRTFKGEERLPGMVHAGPKQTIR